MHLHTRLSRDAENAEWNSVEGYVNTARQTGLKYIAITEHRDIIDGGPDGAINADISECERQVNDQKRLIVEKGYSEVSVLFGIELAHAHTHAQEAKNQLDQHKFDFVLGSLHLLKNDFDFCRADFDSYSDELLMKLYRNYLEELYEIAENSDFDSFAHCTYPLRYLARCSRLMDLCENPAKYAPEYSDIFRKLIERGKALEINTSGIKRGENTLPTVDLLKLYKNLGGRYVTIGSDSHDIHDLGSGVDVAERMLTDLGFDGVTVFVQRQARIIPFN